MHMLEDTKRRRKVGRSSGEARLARLLRHTGESSREKKTLP